MEKKRISLHRTRNSDGMACFTSYLVSTYDHEIVAMDLIGAEVEVKAVWASIVSGRRVTFDGYRRLSAPLYPVVTVRERLDGSTPPLVRWHIVPQVGEDEIAVYGWEEISFSDALFGVLSRYSIWPVLPEWSHALTVLGEEHGLIRPLYRTGCDYAYRVSLQGWDKALEDGLRQGTIRV